jgi:hypothetical protein
MLLDGILRGEGRGLQKVADSHHKLVAVSVLSAALERFASLIADAGTPAGGSCVDSRKAQIVPLSRMSLDGSNSAAIVETETRLAPCPGAEAAAFEQTNQGDMLLQQTAVPELPEDVTAALVGLVLSCLDDRLKLVSAEATRVFSTLCRIAALQQATPVRSVARSHTASTSSSLHITLVLLAYSFMYLARSALGFPDCYDWMGLLRRAF